MGESRTDLCGCYGVPGLRPAGWLYVGRASAVPAEYTVLTRGRTTFVVVDEWWERAALTCAAATGPGLRPAGVGCTWVVLVQCPPSSPS